jgi:hypothetical protein
VPVDATRFDRKGSVDTRATVDAFHTKAYGERAALYDPSAWQVRLLGRLRLDFELAPGRGGTASARRNLWRRLVKPVKETKKATRLYAKGRHGKPLDGEKPETLTWRRPSMLWHR